MKRIYLILSMFLLTIYGFAQNPGSLIDENFEEGVSNWTLVTNGEGFFEKDCNEIIEAAYGDAEEVSPDENCYGKLFTANAPVALQYNTPVANPGALVFNLGIESYQYDANTQESPLENIEFDVYFGGKKLTTINISDIIVPQVYGESIGVERAETSIAWIDNFTVYLNYFTNGDARKLEFKSSNTDVTIYIDNFRLYEFDTHIFDQVLSDPDLIDIIGGPFPPYQGDQQTTLDIGGEPLVNITLIPSDDVPNKPKGYNFLSNFYDVEVDYEAFTTNNENFEIESVCFEYDPSGTEGVNMAMMHLFRAENLGDEFVEQMGAVSGDGQVCIDTPSFSVWGAGSKATEVPLSNWVFLPLILVLGFLLFNRK